MGSWGKGSTRAWRTVRAMVLRRDKLEGWGCRAHDEGWCTRAGVGAHPCTGVPTHAHHTHGRRRTGDDPRFIVAACEPCNLAIGDPAAAADPPCIGVTRW